MLSYSCTAALRGKVHVKPYGQGAQSWINHCDSAPTSVDCAAALAAALAVASLADSPALKRAPGGAASARDARTLRATDNLEVPWLTLDTTAGSGPMSLGAPEGLVKPAANTVLASRGAGT